VKRLFVAVDVDESTREAIATMAATLGATIARGSSLIRVTWVHPDRLHLTVEFLGDVNPAAEQRVRLALDEPIPVAPFTLRFDGLGCFPTAGSPRVLWLGIADGVEGLRRIHEELRRRLGDLAKPEQEFNPHLTLARFRDRVPRQRLKETVAMRMCAGPCTIDRVTLYESRLSPGGPTYTRVADGLLTTCT
jgi:RNA 2',3'-cyclic 3'-phosphodiesterase